jgi:hypothetical protein
MFSFEDAVKVVEEMRSEQQTIAFHARHTNVPMALTELLRKLQAVKDAEAAAAKWAAWAASRATAESRDTDELLRKLQAAKDAGEAVAPKDTDE